MIALDASGYALLTISALAFLGLQSWLAAMVVRRVVGVPIGWPRTLLVGFVMSSVMALAVQYLYRAGSGQNPGGLNVDPVAAGLLLVLTTAWIFALGVAALVVLEASFPTGSVPGLQALFMGWGGRRKRTKRYFGVISIALRHGLGSHFRGFGPQTDYGREKKTARALREALTEAGVTFVKLGQMLSTRRDVLPSSFVRELEGLQSQVSPESWDVIEPAIAQRLGRSPDEVFSNINPVPLAAASVAQVHEATLLNGTEVVLKVQRPQALKQVTRDLDIIIRLARWLERATGWGRALGIETLAVGFAQSLEEELDYRIEVDNMRSIEATLKRSERHSVTVPRAYAELSGERLLVMDRLPGLPVSSAGEMLASLTDTRRQELASTLLGTTLEQIISGGIFHADLHGGNIFITPDGRLGLLDFGSVGRLDPSTQASLGLMLHAIDKDDSAGATDAIIDLLDRPDDLDERAVERSVGELLVRYKYGAATYRGHKIFDDLFALVLAHQFSVPPQIGMAFRALAAVEGALAIIDPGFDVITAAQEEGDSMMRGKIKDTNMFEEMQRRLFQLLPIIDRMPRRINKITEDLEHKRFSINVRVLENPSDRRFLTGLFQQLIVALLSGSAVLGAIMLITSTEGPLLTQGVPLYTFFGFILLFGGFILGMRSLMLVFKQRVGD